MSNLDGLDDLLNGDVDDLVALLNEPAPAPAAPQVQAPQVFQVKQERGRTVQQQPQPQLPFYLNPMIKPEPVKQEATPSRKRPAQQSNLSPAAAAAMAAAQQLQQYQQPATVASNPMLMLSNPAVMQAVMQQRAVQQQMLMQQQQQLNMQQQLQMLAARQQQQQQQAKLAAVNHLQQPQNNLLRHAFSAAAAAQQMNVAQLNRTLQTAATLPIAPSAITLPSSTKNMTDVTVRKINKQVRIFVFSTRNFK